MQSPEYWCRQDFWCKACGDKNCEDFPHQAAAQRELERDSTDPNNLDADDDGQACEAFDYAGGSVDDGPDDQYNTDGKEVTVIVETITDLSVSNIG